MYTKTSIQIYKYKYVNTITQISNQGRIITKREYMHEKLTFLFDGHIKWYWPTDLFNTSVGQSIERNISTILKCFRELQKGEGQSKIKFCEKHQ